MPLGENRMKLHNIPLNVFLKIFYAVQLPLRCACDNYSRLSIFGTISPQQETSGSESECFLKKKKKKSHTEIKIILMA